MRIISHRNGTYTITDLTRSDIRDLERSVYADYANWIKSSTATSVPSHHVGWSLETYRSINRDIAERMLEIGNILQPIAYPPYTEDF